MSEPHTVSLPTSPRALSDIAYEIRRNWSKVYFAAEPYLAAMATLHSIHDNYMYDSADSIVRYFLVNATTWKGEVARRIKAELRTLLKER